MKVTVKLLLNESGGREKSEVIKWQHIGEYVKDPFKKRGQSFLEQIYNGETKCTFLTLFAAGGISSKACVRTFLYLYFQISFGECVCANVFDNF